MIRLIILFSILMFSVNFAGASTEGSKFNKSTKIMVGMQAPKFTIQQINGIPFTLTEKPTIIWFMTHWCDYMGSEYPQMAEDCANAEQKLNSAYGQYKDKFQWIAISFASNATNKNINAYRSQQNIQFAMGIDVGRDIWASYGVRYAPTVIIVDKGKVIYREQACLDKFEDFLAKGIARK